MTVEQELEHILAAAQRPEPFFDNRLEQVAILPTSGIVIETLIVQQLRLAHILNDALPLLIQHREDNPAIARLKQTARSGARPMASGRTGVVIAVEYTRHR